MSRSSPFKSPMVSPQNRQNVIPFERDPFVQELTAALGTQMLEEALETEHDITSRTGAKYVLYKVPKPVGDVLHKRFYFQDTNEFDMEWFSRSIQYTQTLGLFDRFVLKSYTKYGDEIVNNYLRDPDGFRSSERVKDLLFDIMPMNHHLCFAIQFLKHHFVDEDEKNTNAIIANFLNGNGELMSGEVNDLLEIWDKYRYNYDEIIPIVEDYITDISRIIADAPKPTRPMRVFRGTKRDYLRNSVGVVENSRGFISTSMNPDATFGFKARKNAYEMIINPNVSCVVTEKLTYFPYEYEVLIGPNTIVKADRKHKKFDLNIDEGYGDYDSDAVYDPEGYDIPRVYSRLVAVSDAMSPMTGGRSSVHKNLKVKVSKMTRSARSKMLQTKQNSKKAVKTRKNKGAVYESDGEYRRPNLDPVLVKGPPVPKEVEDYLDSLLKQFH